VTGENLVPKPPVQAEESSPREGTVGGRRRFYHITATSFGSGARTRRTAVPHAGPTSAAELARHSAIQWPLLHDQLDSGRQFDAHVRPLCVLDTISRRRYLLSPVVRGSSIVLRGAVVDDFASVWNCCAAVSGRRQLARRRCV